jgi:hypothetical protein
MYKLILNSNNVVGNTNTLFRYNFIQGSLKIPEGSEICVSQMVVPYSFFNLNAQFYSNTTIKFNWLGTNYTYTYANGFYQTSDLNNALQLYMISLGLYLYDTSRSQNVYYIQILSNTTYYANTIYCFPIPSSLPTGFTNPSGNFVFSSGANTYTPQVSFPSNLCTILGFSKNVLYPSTQQTTGYSINSTTTPNASPVNSLILRCSLVNNPCTNPTDILDSFYPNATFGSNINYVPAYQKWCKANPGAYSQFDVVIVDQNFNQIQANDPNVLISILLKVPDKIFREPVKTLEEPVEEPIPIIKPFRSIKFMQ